MAFCQPTAAPARQVSALEPPSTSTIALSSAQHTSLQQSQEWVLFSPSHARSFPKSTSTEQTPRTAGLSRLSDFGSFNTFARSGQNDGDVSEVVDDADGDDEDLDSLDEGLHAFQEPSWHQSPRYFDQSGSILPTHDGLGTFQASSGLVQEQLWHFEKYNPRKRSTTHARRTSSVQRHLDAVADNDVARIESERMARIEKWRIEQSKFLLKSIENGITGGRTSESSRRTVHDVSASGADKAIQMSLSSDTHSLDQVGTKNGKLGIEDESLWDGITRRIIRDLLGIDEALLAVIFGESLAAEDPFSVASSTQASRPVSDMRGSIPTATWDTRLLERIARELGIFVKHLTDHPGAFNTRFNPANLDYAGIPTGPPTSIQPEPSPPPLLASTDSISPRFKPTLEGYKSRPSTSASDTTHAALWGIEEEPPGSSPSPEAQERNYWERTPDLGGIFRVLHHRFSSSHQSPTSTPNIATTATPASLRRAAVIRQHHPLVSRAATTASMRRSSRNAAVIFHHYHYRRTESSCKSLSVRKGGRGGSGSSRNYWDVGGGGGSAGGSALAAAAGGGIGAWGETC
ncbi:hypothetical protein MMC07_008599 [Pseudocyphellaria aurata]|nr:hypothetical protein [Pseudocyphellaria aurata]